MERSADVGLISITGTSQADRSQPQSFSIRQSVSGANSSCNAGVTRQGACPNVIMMPSHVLVSSRCRVTMSLSLPNICALRWLSLHNPEIGIAPVISVYGLCRLEPSSNNQFLLKARFRRFRIYLLFNGFVEKTGIRRSTVHLISLISIEVLRAELSAD